MKNPFENLDRIESKLFDVMKLQLHPNMEGFNSPTSYGIYKGEGGDPLGVVGKDYEPQQPKLIFNSLLETVLDIEQIDAENIKYYEMKGGKKIRFEMPVATINFKNMVGADDVSEVYLNLQTGFDGFTKTTLYLSTMRLICTNGMKASHTEFSTSFKNTKNNVGKSVTMINEISKGLQGITQLEELYTRLNKVQVNQEKVDDFLTKVTGYNVKEYNDLNTRKRNILDNINKSIELEFARTGATMFGLLNGITHYTNHVASGFQDPDYIFVDAGSKMNDKALQYVLSV